MGKEVPAVWGPMVLETAKEASAPKVSESEPTFNPFIPLMVPVPVAVVIFPDWGMGVPVLAFTWTPEIVSALMTKVDPLEAV